MGENKLAVVGGGLMGSGIAEVAARRGITTVVTDISDEAAAAAKGRVEKSMGRSIAKGKLAQEDADAAMQLLTFSGSIDAAADADIVIEAATENVEAKDALFRKLGEIVQREDAILASNTSSLQIIRLGTAAGRPEWTVGLHFFSPVPLMKLVEVIPSLATVPEAKERAFAFVSGGLGKEVIEAPDRPGFVVNVLLVPYMMSAIRLLEGGHATAEDIDKGMRLGCGHPMGPLELIDNIGLDTVRGATLGMYNEFKDPLYAPPPLLNRLVDAGFLGKKTGRGFYDYSA